MARSNKRITKPAIKASKAPKLGYGQTSKNYSTLRRMTKADFDESLASINEKKIFVIDSLKEFKQLLGLRANQTAFTSEPTDYPATYLVVNGVITPVKNMTFGEYSELRELEEKIYAFISKMRTWNPESVRLNNYRRKFLKLATKLNILNSDGETVKYVCSELDLDFSHSYNFGDLIC